MSTLNEFEEQVRAFDEAAPGTGEPKKLIWDKPLDLPSLYDTAPEPYRWFIDKRMLDNREYVFDGIGGSSKTTIVKQIAVGTVLGRLPWSWEIKTPGRAVLVLTEDTIEEAHRSIYNICESMALTPEEKWRVYNGVIIYPLAGDDVILLKKTPQHTLQNTPLFNGLVQLIQDKKDVRFIGLDPALSLTDGDELDQGHQRRLGKMADNLAVLTSANVVLVAHAPKNTKEEITSHNSRGGGALVDAVRGEYVMRTMTRKEALDAKITDLEERLRHVQLVAVKGNHLPPDAYRPLWLRRDDRGVLHGADVSFSDTDTGPTKNDMDALKVLVELWKESTPKLIEWRNALIEKGIIAKGNGKAQETAMERIKTRLYESGLIRSVKRGYWKPEEPEEEDFMDFNDA